MQAKVTSKGQVTLPKRLRESLAIRAGDRLEFSLDHPHRFYVRKKRAPGSSAGCGQRYCQPVQKPISVEEMDAGVRQAIREKFGQIDRGA